MSSCPKASTKDLEAPAVSSERGREMVGWQCVFCVGLLMYEHSKHDMLPVATVQAEAQFLCSLHPHKPHSTVVLRLICQDQGWQG